MMSCEGCKWLVDNGTWCDMIRTRVNPTEDECSQYDDSDRYFEPKVFFRLCKDFVTLYDSSVQNTTYMKSEDESFNYNETELLGFVLNDIKREIQFYHRGNLYDDLNRKDEDITQG